MEVYFLDSLVHLLEDMASSILLMITLKPCPPSIALTAARCAQENRKGLYLLEDGQLHAPGFAAYKEAKSLRSELSRNLQEIKEVPASKAIKTKLELPERPHFLGESFATETGEELDMKSTTLNVLEEPESSSEVLILHRLLIFLPVLQSSGSAQTLPFSQVMLLAYKRKAARESIPTWGCAKHQESGGISAVQRRKTKEHCSCLRGVGKEKLENVDFFPL
nr:hypothetical protein Iba_chr01dCG5530 [Ipomoea batatas]